MPLEGPLTLFENLALSELTIKKMNEWDKSVRHPALGKMGARFVGPLITFLTCVIDAVFHACLSVAKTVVIVIASPYQVTSLCFFPGKALPNDLQGASILIHLFRVIEKIFFAGTLPILLLFAPEKAYALINGEAIKITNAREIQALEDELKLKETDAAGLKNAIKFHKEKFQKICKDLIEKEKSFLQLRQEFLDMKKVNIEYEFEVRSTIQQKNREIEDKTRELLKLTYEVNVFNETNLNKEQTFAIKLREKEEELSKTNQTLSHQLNELNFIKEKNLKNEKKFNDDLCEKDKEIVTLKNQICTVHEEIRKVERKTYEEIQQKNAEMQQIEDEVHRLKTDYTFGLKTFLRKEKEYCAILDAKVTDLAALQEQIGEVQNERDAAESKALELEYDTIEMLKEINAEINKKNNEIILLQSDISIRKQLPHDIFLKGGILSVKKLTAYLTNNPPHNYDEIFLWSFSQRKSLNEMECSLTSDGIFIDNALIREIDPCIRYEDLVGYYADGKSIIHQTNENFRAGTLLTMAFLDRNVLFDSNSLYQLQVPFEGLQIYGQELIALDFSEITENDGSIIAQITHKKSGYKILIDYIEDQWITFRDPAHGWRITMPKEEFIKNVPCSFFKIAEQSY